MDKENINYEIDSIIIENIPKEVLDLLDIQYKNKISVDIIIKEVNSEL